MQTELEHIPTRSPALAALKARAGAGMRAVLDVILPPQCLACRALVMEPGLLCATCYAAVRPIGAPWCGACGIPLEGAGFGGEAAMPLCGRCLERRPAFTRARAVFTYEETARRLVHDLKYHDRPEGRASFGRWLARAGAEFLAEADFICPVPLHYTRLVRRRFNQSAMLAQALGRAAARPVIVDALKRVRRTASQAGLSAEERARNVRGAFALRARHAARAAGAHVVLVDDVITTGATAEACALALKKAGAREVSVLSLARVARPD